MQKTQSGQQPKRRGRKPKAKPVEGLGDAIEVVTKATGIKKAVEIFSEATGVDCGCDKRKEQLNKLFSIRQRKTPLECMTREMYDKWRTVRDIKKNDQTKYIRKVYPIIAELHAELYQHNYHEPCSCTPKTWNNWREDIELTFNLYKEELETS